MDYLIQILQQLFGQDLKAAGFVVVNLIIIESLLSVDNAAVLATMVMDLPRHQRAKALRYGIIGAYVFRGICLLLASWIINFGWLKALGGLYLLWLAINYFRSRATPKDSDDTLNKDSNKVYKAMLRLLGGPFWATVVFVEIMDLAFSIDNVFAAVAFTDNLYLIWIGVFLGILSMRFVAQGFVQLMERFTFLEPTSFIVIALLGIKLLLAYISEFDKTSAFYHLLNSEETDLYVSILTVLIFFVPVLSALLFKYPRPKEAEHSIAQKK